MRTARRRAGHSFLSTFKKGADAAATDVGSETRIPSRARATAHLSLQAYRTDAGFATAPITSPTITQPLAAPADDSTAYSRSSRRCGNSPACAVGECPTGPRKRVSLRNTGDSRRARASTHIHGPMACASPTAPRAGPAWFAPRPKLLPPFLGAVGQTLEPERAKVVIGAIVASCLAPIALGYWLCLSADFASVASRACTRLLTRAKGSGHAP
ncbi:hypothetical protein PYCCODRAFT_1184835 [Trametes coccinea BRFM310]|uniref:Uncharacterized protein n=1 Tax=Trametes coccinea (strain BRFM310) TaxID=1353009 RepID=A0A1Y2I9X9_TRAC3|nr:hypothetical protein PYCCODRAFT_1184835 [Trametes coccinea BRFM310]